MLRIAYADTGVCSWDIAWAWQPSRVLRVRWVWAPQYFLNESDEAQPRSQDEEGFINVDRESGTCFGRAICLTRRLWRSRTCRCMTVTLSRTRPSCFPGPSGWDEAAKAVSGWMRERGESPPPERLARGGTGPKILSSTCPWKDHRGFGLGRTQTTITDLSRDIDTVFLGSCENGGSVVVVVFSDRRKRHLNLLFDHQDSIIQSWYRIRHVLCSLRCNEKDL